MICMFTVVCFCTLVAIDCTLVVDVVNVGAVVVVVVVAIVVARYGAGSMFREGRRHGWKHTTVFTAFRDALENCRTYHHRFHGNHKLRKAYNMCLFCVS